MAEKSSSQPADLKSAFKQLENLLNDYLGKRAPALPSKWKELIVNIAPWLSLILVIFALPAILFAFGLGALLAPFSFLGAVRYGVNFSLSLIFSLIILVVEILAIPGLFKRAKGAWNLLYYATLIGVLQNIITFNLGGLIIGSLLSLYFLFQIKEYYK